MSRSLARDGRNQLEPTLLAAVRRAQNRAGRADCDASQAIAGKVHVKQIEEGFTRLRRPGKA